MPDDSLPPPPTPEASKEALEALGGRIERTPVRRWVPDAGVTPLPEGAEVFLKLELFQRTGTFKARGALTHLLTADPADLEAGVTAVSAGNHAIAVAYAARTEGTTAHVVMLSSANPERIGRCRRYGAEVEFAPDGRSGFARVREIEREEGRRFLHPYEGEATILGTSTLGLELCEQLPLLEAVVVPVGGGGLIAGVAAAVKQVRPECEVFGVEPVGADSMYRSLLAGEPVAIDGVDTIADSLGAPHAAPYGYSLVDRFVDGVVLVDDDAIRAAMRALLADAKLVAEPACAAPLAAVAGPLRERLAGKRIALVLSGSNIDLESLRAHIEAAPPPEA